MRDRQRDVGAVFIPPEIAERSPKAKDRASSLYGRIAVGMFLADVAALEIALFVSRQILSGRYRFESDYYLLVAIAPLVVAAVFTPLGLYRPSRMSPAEEFRRLLGAVSIAIVVLAFGGNALSTVLLSQQHRVALSMRWMGVNWLVALLLVLTDRQIWHKAIRRLRKTGALAYRTVIIGTNTEADELASHLLNRSLGFSVIGMIEPNGKHLGPGGAPVLGAVDELSAVIREHRIECAFIASSSMRPETMMRALKVLRRMRLEVRVSANMPEILASRLSVQAVGNNLALSLQQASLTGPQALVKRVFDLLLASAGLILTSPIWLVSAITIKITSKGPILFRQKRIGRHGEPFTLYKFRTMVNDAESRPVALEARRERADPLFKLKDDPRRTGVGRLLRRWSIDELPQLLNVVNGTMSMVGPRPMPATFDASYYEDWHLERLEVPPGITGLWQVSGRSDLSFNDCVRLDLFYIENWSVTYDLYILIKTIPAVIFRKGAY
jgi:exopolysaccharide biosynthesis polyprenyl glycosylphosphotransferase